MKKNNKKGFTLVELVIVVAVMAILVAVAIPTISSISSSAQDSVNQSNARTIESVIKLKEADLSKSGSAVTIGATDIDDAVTAAKLGIESGSYTYNSDTGSVSHGGSAETATSKEFVITFDGAKANDSDTSNDKDIVTVTKGTK